MLHVNTEKYELLYYRQLYAVIKVKDYLIDNYSFVATKGQSFGPTKLLLILQFFLVFFVETCQF